MTWDGETPLPGQYVKTRKGLYAYEVIEIVPTPGLKSRTHKFVVDKKPAGSLRPADVVHEFKWNKR